MKNIFTALLISTTFISPAFAVDVTGVTNTTTDVITNQDSGISLSGKAKILPHATVSTGDNTATTDVRTSVDTDPNASAGSGTNVESNNSYHKEKVKGHKYGHDKH